MRKKKTDCNAECGPAVSRRKLQRSASNAINSREKAELGFTFSPAGFLFVYHYGVYYYLRSVGVIDANVPIVGASAGALIAMVAAVDMDIYEVFYILYQLTQKCREHGTRGLLGKNLREFLGLSLNEEHVRLANRRAQPVGVTYSALSIFGFQRVTVSKFRNKKDLIDCLVASCNIPYYSFLTPLVRVRNQYAVDGFFCDTANFGCPDNDSVKFHVRVIPFDATVTLSHIEPIKTISPSLARYDYLLSPESVKQFLEYVVTNPAPKPRLVCEKLGLEPLRPAEEEPRSDGIRSMPTVILSDNYFAAVSQEMLKLSSAVEKESKGFPSEGEQTAMLTGDTAAQPVASELAAPSSSNLLQIFSPHFWYRRLDSFLLGGSFSDKVQARFEDQARRPRASVDHYARYQNALEKESSEIPNRFSFSWRDLLSLSPCTLR